MKPGPDAVDQSEVISSDEEFEDQYAELPYADDFEPPTFPNPDEAPWFITAADGVGNSDSLDYAWSLNHYDSGY